MGLYKEDTNTYADSIRVVNGKLAQRVEEGTEGAVKRIFTIKRTGEERTVWERYYPGLEGKIVKGEIKTLEFGQILELLFENGEERARVEVPFPGRLAEQIIQRIVNADLSKPISIYAGWDKIKDRNFVWLKQDGNKIKSSYLKDDPGDAPPVEQKVIFGITKWNSEKRDTFLYDKFVKIFGESETKCETKSDSQPVSDAKPTVNNVVDEDDDLPF